MVSPKALKKGNKVIIISPSRQINNSQIERAIEVLESWGLEVSVGDYAFSRSGYFAGTDSERLKDLQDSIDNQKIAAIFCARGGYGLSRIIDHLDLSGLTRHPKWIIGFSDITALHLRLNLAGIESIHGLMPVQFEYDGVDNSIDSLYNMLFNNEFKYNWEGNTQNNLGECTAEIVGGNLSLLVDSLGTKTEIRTDNKILFIEEIDEYFYKIDRMLNHLNRAGKFSKLAGLVIGQFSDLKDTQIPFGFNLIEIIKSNITNKQVPIAFDAPIGHEAHNLSIPIGRKIYLNVMKDKVVLKG